MEAVKTLKPLPDFLQAAPVQELFSALGEGNALVVGGAVRKALQNRPVDDIDIATKLTPVEVERHLRGCGFHIIPTGLAHGTLTVLKDGYSFEITTLRADVETDGRHAVVQQTDDWIEDARRRDFTFNTLLLNSHGEVFDPLGEGLVALEQGMVCFVGDAATRIREDYLRSFRFYRFWATVGAEDFVPDWITDKALRETQEGISALSKERITNEMLKLFASDRTESMLTALRHMKGSGLLPSPEYTAANFEKLKTVLAYGEAASLMTRLFAFYGEDVDFKAREIYMLSNQQLKELSNFKLALHKLSQLSELEIKRAAYLYGVPATIGALQINGREWSDIYEPPKFPLKAAHIQAVEPLEGLELGGRLRQLEADWLDSGFNNNVLKPYL